MKEQMCGLELIFPSNQKVMLYLHRIVNPN
jgi:hypothetical protein